MNKIWALLIPAGVIAGVVVLTKRKAKADEQKESVASPSDASVLVDATEGTPVVVPSSPVVVPAPVVSTTASADKVEVSPGSLDVVIPSMADVTPVSPDVGENDVNGEAVPIPQGGTVSVQTPGVNLDNPFLVSEVPAQVVTSAIDAASDIASNVLNVPKVSERPADSIALVKKLLAEEASANWKYVDPAVAAWQASRGLKNDGKFGPGTSLALAQEAGMTALVRWWPLGSALAGQLTNYRTALRKLAVQELDPVVSADLVTAADREEGQSYRKATVPAVSPIAWEAV